MRKERYIIVDKFNNIYYSNSRNARKLAQEFGKDVWIYENTYPYKYVSSCSISTGTTCTAEFLKKYNQKPFENLIELGVLADDKKVKKL